MTQAFNLSQLANNVDSSGKLSLTTGVDGVLPVANGGTGTATPSLVAGSNITITGSFPNQTVTASGGVPAAGNIGSYIVASSTALATAATAYAIGVAVAGSTLRISSNNAHAGLSNDNTNVSNILVSPNFNPSYSGTWELRSRMYSQVPTAGSYPVNLFVRIS